MTIESKLPLLDPARLAERVADRFRESARDGSRVVLESREEIVDDGGVPFVVRVLRARGGAASASSAPAVGSGGTAAPEPAASPFLPPYEPGLLVGAISPTHLVLLNKYNIVDRHLLIVTRAFAEQETPLGVDDLQAAGTCLEAIDGVVFFNSGRSAGASQRHKHLQLVPFPLGPGIERFPLDRAVGVALADGVERLEGFDYRHRLVALPPPAVGPGGAARALAIYRDLVGTFALEPSGEERMAPHNLLMTREWMMIVPRARASCGPVEVNALGFAGALVARGEEGLTAVREVGPRRVLREVAVPWDEAVGG